MVDDNSHRDRREREKAEAVLEIRSAIAGLRAVNLPLDKWQRTHLARAIGESFNGLYQMSRCSARLVEWPIGRRSDALIEEEKEIVSMTLGDFESYVDELEVEPAKLRPFFFRRR